MTKDLEPNYLNMSLEEINSMTRETDMSLLVYPVYVEALKKVATDNNISLTEALNQALSTIDEQSPYFIIAFQSLMRSDSE